MDYKTQRKLIRRFLRDPDGNIWADHFLLNLFNDAQRDLQLETGFLENVQAISVPQYYQFSYMYDFEWKHCEGTRHHRCLKYHQQGQYTFCHRWEVHIELHQTGTAQEVGDHFTHPWEAWMCTAGDTVAVAFPEDYYRSKVVAYDFEPLRPVDKQTVMRKDSSYQTKQGQPVAYYRDDELENSFVIYPRPSSVEWNDVVNPVNPDFLYTYDWESTYFSGSGERWLRSGTYEYTYIWENDIDTQSDSGIRGMYLFESGIHFTGYFGQILYSSGESLDATGAYAYGELFSQESGIAVTAINGTNNIICIYDAMAKEIQADYDESDFPVFMRKYINHGVISRAYGANTDGKIQSLKEYWMYRFQMGVEMIKRFQTLRKSDRNYRLMQKRKPRQRRHPRLPDTYPDVNF